jgi:hypothetical protein
MAQFEFNATEIAILKKAAAEAQKAGAERAKAIIKESGIEFTASPELKALAAPEAGITGNNVCYSCIACVITFAVSLVLYTR